MSQTEQRLNFRVVKPLVRRCRWCEINTANGMPRYLVNGEWTMILIPKLYFGEDAEYTDTLCPACAAKMRKQIEANRKTP